MYRLESFATLISLDRLVKIVYKVISLQVLRLIREDSVYELVLIQLLEDRITVGENS